MILSRWRSPTFHPTSTSWVSCWTLSGLWDWAAPVTIECRTSSCTSPPLPTRTSSRWIPCSPRELPPPPFSCPFHGVTPQWFLFGSDKEMQLFLFLASAITKQLPVQARKGYTVWNGLSQREGTWRALWAGPWWPGSTWAVCSSLLGTGWGPRISHVGGWGWAGWACVL